MTLTNEEQIHRNRLEYLLINSGPFDIAIRKAIAYALDLIEEKEKAP